MVTALQFFMGSDAAKDEEEDSEAEVFNIPKKLSVQNYLISPNFSFE